jgi:hypothetical protein
VHLLERREVDLIIEGIDVLDGTPQNDINLEHVQTF